MYFCVFFALFVMAGFDDDDYSLSGLTQEGHEVDVTVIFDSEESVDNFAGLLECAKVLETGKKCVKTEDSMVVTKQAAEVDWAEVHAEGAVLELPSSGLNVSNSMVSSISDQGKNFHVSFVNIYALEVD